MENKTQTQIAMLVGWQTIVANLLLAVFKFVAGLVSGSVAIVSDAVHTASDVCSTVFVMIGVRMAGKESDSDHPYGHERFECVAAIVLAVALFATGIGIGSSGLQRITNPSALAVPGRIALVAAAASIAVKEAMYWYTRWAAGKARSSAMMADAWHHRSDALSSVGSLVAVLGARMGYPILDPVACLVICVLILKTAVSIFCDAVGKMTDKACDSDTTQQITRLIIEQEGVLSIDQLRTRLFGDKIYIDVEISADGNASLYQTHEAAHRVHDAIESHFPQVKHCMVHVNPAKGVEGRDRAKTAQQE